MPWKEETGKPHGRSAKLQALHKVNGSVSREKKEGTLSALFPYEYEDRYALLASLQFVVFRTGERHRIKWIK
jgi:hypothetical protein